MPVAGKLNHGGITFVILLRLKKAYKKLTQFKSGDFLELFQVNLQQILKHALMQILVDDYRWNTLARKHIQTIA